SWSVDLPIALATTTTSLPASRAATARRATRLRRSASATLVPPNFITMSGRPVERVSSLVMRASDSYPAPESGGGGVLDMLGAGYRVRHVHGGGAVGTLSGQSAYASSGSNVAVVADAPWRRATSSTGYSSDSGSDRSSATSRDPTSNSTSGS